jgi:hypothetical protein
VARLRLNQPEKVLPLLKHSRDPRVRSYLMDRLAPLGTDAGAIIKRHDEESDLTIRRALVLTAAGRQEWKTAFIHRFTFFAGSRNHLICHDTRRGQAAAV